MHIHSGNMSKVWVVYIVMPPSLGIKRRCCLMSVCLSVGRVHRA